MDRPSYTSFGPAAMSAARQELPAPVDINVSTLADTATVEMCHNLRPCRCGQPGLEGVGVPAVAAVCGTGEVEFVPGGVLQPPGGRETVLLRRGTMLLGMSGGSVTAITDLGAVPLSAVGMESKVVVMTEDGPRMLAYNGAVWNEVPVAPSLIPLILHRLDTVTLSASVGAMRLQDTYSSRSAALTDRDRASLGAVVTEAYMALASEAAAHSCYMQPVMARYRLLGDGGVTLYESAPVLVSPSGGLQGLSAVFTVGGDGFTGVGETVLTAGAYTIGVRMSRPADDIWRACVRAVEICVSPQMHPLREGLLPVCTMSNFTATHARLQVLLPGVSNLTTPGSPGSVLDMQVTSVLDNITSAMRPVAALVPDAVSGRLPAGVNPYDASVRDVSAEIATLRRLGEAPRAAPDGDEADLMAVSSPHSFTAQVSAVNGGSVVWGNITAVPFDGYTAPEMAASFTASGGSQPGAVLVTMADGSSVVRALTARECELTEMSALLVYPSPDAVGMTLLMPGRKLSVDLRPTPCRHWAYALSQRASVRQLPVCTDAYVVPSASPVRRRLPSAVALASLRSPLDPVALVRTGTGSVVALEAAPRVGASLDSSRTDFYAFGNGGCDKVSANISSGRLSSARIDSRGVESASGVCHTGGYVAALAAGSLVVMRGNEARTLLSSCPGRILGWNARREELWCAGGTEDTLTVVSPATPGPNARFTRDDPGVRSMLSTPRGLLMVCSGGSVLDASTEEDAQLSVAYRAMVCAGSDVKGLRMLRMHLSGSGVEGTVGVYGSPGPCGAAKSVSFGMKGCLRPPVSAMVDFSGLYRPFVEIRLTSSRPTSVKILRKR